MKPVNLKTREASRLSRHYKRTTSSGTRRVEIMIPSRDAPLVKAIAGALRSDGVEAKLIRQSLHQGADPP